MKRLFLIGTTLVALMGLGANAQAAGATSGKHLFLVCSTCHGANGEGKVNLQAPRIGGQAAWYIERQLNNFQKGIRGRHAQDTYGLRMGALSKALPPDNSASIQSTPLSYKKSNATVSAYVAGLNAPDAPASVKGDAAAGAASFAVCQGCHGANAEGNKALNAPKLSGQHGWYLVRQINNFKHGIRGTDPSDVGGMTMRPMAGMLVDETAINNVVAYIQTLK